MAILSGRQARDFRDALLSTFNLFELRQMVYFNLDQSLETITLTGGLEERVFDLISWAERKGQTDRLIEGAMRDAPGSGALTRFVASYGRSIQKSVGNHDLERIVERNSTFKDARLWRDRLERIERQVCRIELGPEARGSGFLVAKSVVLTNHHVVEEVIAGSAQPTDLTARFGYQQRIDHAVSDEGVTYKVDNDWLIDHSPYDVVDLEPNPKDYEPDRDHLDYAFLRLEKPAGEEQVEGGSRGFIAFPSGPPALEIGGPLFIVQHPRGQPLKLALNTQSITEVNGQLTRVRHKTNTDEGSSGSPCFDSDWNLVALHHSGDPNGVKPEYNEGIPITTIQAVLTESVKKQVGWS